MRKRKERAEKQIPLLSEAIPRTSPYPLAHSASTGDRWKAYLASPPSRVFPTESPCLSLFPTNFENLLLLALPPPLRRSRSSLTLPYRPERPLLPPSCPNRSSSLDLSRFRPPSSPSLTSPFINPPDRFTLLISSASNSSPFQGRPLLLASFP